MTDIPHQNTIEMPRRVALLPRDPRGYPIPWIQYRDQATGLPDFRINDHERVLLAVAKRACGICGEKLGAHLFFIGGPRCAWYGYFYDPPMHRDCALFAMKTCPHLSCAKGRYNEGAWPTTEDATFQILPTETDKPEAYALMHTKSFECARESGTEALLIKAELPWLDVSWWRDGKETAEPALYMKLKKTQSR